MKKAAAFILGIPIVLLAVYGAISLCSSLFLTKSQGEKAADAAHPFIQGALDRAGENFKETLRNTPDEKLEKDAEFFAKKMYPVGKGAIKGHMEALKEDVNRSEVPQKMYEAGKDITEKVLKPLSEGVLDGSGKVIKDVDKTLQNVRKFSEDNKDVFDAVTQGLSKLHEKLKELPPPHLPPPGPGLGRPFTGPQSPDNTQTTPEGR